MNSTEYSAVDACRDCVLYLANGDVPEDREDLPDAIAANWDGFTLALGCSRDCCGEADEPWFSWSACEVCGSNLGGDREHVTPFIVEE